MANGGWDPWKMTAIGLGLVGVVAVITGVVVANWSGGDVERKAETPTATTRSASPHEATRAAGTSVVSVRETAAPAAPPAAPPAPIPATTSQPATVPSQAAIDACNQQAAAQSSQKSKTREIVTDGAIGAVAGAVVGAVGGAIAGGGSGAGKGAAIGGILGTGGGALYGLNESRKNDVRYREAYASCIRSRGYTG